MSDQYIIFLCDDQVKRREKSWIGDFMTAVDLSVGRSGQRTECVHIPTVDMHEVDGEVHITHFLNEIKNRVDKQEFCVVSDALFGEQQDGGAALLARLANEDGLKVQFKRGLVYSVQPELGKWRSEPKVRALKRPSADGSVAYQAPIIIDYLATGKLRELQELQDYCLRIKAALDWWLKTSNSMFVPKEWNIGGGRVEIFGRETARLFEDLDGYLADRKWFKLFGTHGDLLHRVLCPYQSLCCAAKLNPDFSSNRNRCGGWIRLAFELQNQEGFAYRKSELLDGSTEYQRKWICHHADRLEALLKIVTVESATFVANLREGVAFELEVIDAFLKKLRGPDQ